MHQPMQQPATVYNRAPISSRVAPAMQRDAREVIRFRAGDMEVISGGSLRVPVRTAASTPMSGGSLRVPRKSSPLPGSAVPPSPGGEGSFRTLRTPGGSFRTPRQAPSQFRVKGGSPQVPVTSVRPESRVGSAPMPVTHPSGISRLGSTPEASFTASPGMTPSTSKQELVIDGSALAHMSTPSSLDVPAVAVLAQKDVALVETLNDAEETTNAQKQASWAGDVAYQTEADAEEIPLEHVEGATVTEERITMEAQTHLAEEQRAGLPHSSAYMHVSPEENGDAMLSDLQFPVDEHRIATAIAKAQQETDEAVFKLRQKIEENLESERVVAVTQAEEQSLSAEEASTESQKAEAERVVAVTQAEERSLSAEEATAEPHNAEVNASASICIPDMLENTELEDGGCPVETTQGIESMGEDEIRDDGAGDAITQSRRASVVEVPFEIGGDIMKAENLAEAQRIAADLAKAQEIQQVKADDTAFCLGPSLKQEIAENIAHQSKLVERMSEYDSTKYAGDRAAGPDRFDLAIETCAATSKGGVESDVDARDKHVEAASVDGGHMITVASTTPSDVAAASSALLNTAEGEFSLCSVDDRNGAQLPVAQEEVAVEKLESTTSTLNKSGVMRKVLFMGALGALLFGVLYIFLASFSDQGGTYEIAPSHASPSVAPSAEHHATGRNSKRLHANDGDKKGETIEEKAIAQNDGNIAEQGKQAAKEGGKVDTAERASKTDGLAKESGEAENIKQTSKERGEAQKVEQASKEHGTAQVANVRGQGNQATKETGEEEKVEQASTEHGIAQVANVSGQGNQATKETGEEQKVEQASKEHGTARVASVPGQGNQATKETGEEEKVEQASTEHGTAKVASVPGQGNQATKDSGEAEKLERASTGLGYAQVKAKGAAKTAPHRDGDIADTNVFAVVLCLIAVGIFCAIWSTTCNSKADAVDAAAELQQPLLEEGAGAAQEAIANGQPACSPPDDQANESSAGIIVSPVKLHEEAIAAENQSLVCDAEAVVKDVLDNESKLAADEIVPKRVSKRMAVAAGAGVGALASSASGTAVGAAAGVPLALFTFGLSIPIGAAVGGSVGAVGGAVGGGVVGHVIHSRSPQNVAVQEIVEVADSSEDYTKPVFVEDLESGTVA